MKEISEMSRVEVTDRMEWILETIQQVEQAMDTEIHNHVFTGDKKLNEETMLRLSLRLIELKLQREQIRLRQAIHINNAKAYVAAKVAKQGGRA